MNNGRVVVEFGQDDLETLLRWSASSLASVRCAVRANMVLMAATGFSDRVIAQELGAGAGPSSFRVEVALKNRM